LQRRRLRPPKARTQLGASGIGNQFVEFGIVRLTEPALGWGCAKPDGVME
jgi:hypothetical protein